MNWALLRAAPDAGVLGVLEVSRHSRVQSRAVWPGPSLDCGLGAGESFPRSHLAFPGRLSPSFALMPRKGAWWCCIPERIGRSEGDGLAFAPSSRLLQPPVACSSRSATHSPPLLSFRALRSSGTRWPWAHRSGRFYGQLPGPALALTRICRKPRSDGPRPRRDPMHT